MNDFADIIGGEKLTLVDFFASWCGPCKMQSPVIDEVKARMGDSVNVLKVDVDRNQSLAERFRIRSVPTLIVFKNGEAVWRGHGVHQADALESMLRERMYSSGVEDA